MRLQLLNQIGRYQDVLAEVERLRQKMDGLSEQSDREEAAAAWNVREMLLDTGRFAALQTGAWQQCLDLNAAILASKQARHASDLELAATRFNDYFPLLSLDRIADARRLLLECRRVYDEHNDYARLGRVLSALASLEKEVGHLDRAVDAEHSALRYKYLAGQPNDCAISHFNLANYLRRWLASAQRSPVPADASKPEAPAKDASAAHGVATEVRGSFDGVFGLDERTALAHRLADACICFQTQDGTILQSLQALSRELSALSPTSPAAALVAEDGSGFEALAGIVEQVEGVRFRELFARLPATRAATGPEALRQVLALARSESGGASQSEFEQLLQGKRPS
jgi:tetratricopeptide (TPR) repeat protein